MRGRRPRPLEIAPHDVPILQQIARSRSLPGISPTGSGLLLAVAAGEPIRTLAIRTQCNPSTVWRICRRYEDAGLPDLLEPPQRAGRPARISALQRAQIVQLACREPVAKGLHITPLGRARIWPVKRSRWDCPGHQRSDGPSDPQSGGPPAASHAVLGGRLRIDTSRSVPKRSSALRQRRAVGLVGASVVCADEKPNFQVLERHPIRHSIPGSIVQCEFHGSSVLKCETWDFYCFVVASPFVSMIRRRL